MAQTTITGGPPITTIALASANCYLLPAGGDFVLIDTGLPSKRDEIDQALERAGCAPDRLKRIG